MPTFNKSDMRLVGNEVYVVEQEVDFVQIDDNYIRTEKGFCIILYTTDKGYSDVIQLNRSKFLKPVTDTELDNISESEFKKITDDNDEDRLEDFQDGFIAGYNANQNEFTREQMEYAMNAVAMCGLHVLQIPEYIRGYLDGLHSLSLPEQITIENNHITDVKWKD